MKNLPEIKKGGTKKQKASKNSIKGKQMLVGGLVVLVAVAGYYRYSLNQAPPKKAEAEETVPVMTTVKEPNENYFVLARQDKDSARSESENLLSKIAEDDEATADAKAEAREKLEQSADDIKTEGEIESLVKTKGYKDCIVYIDEDEMRIVIKTDKLDEDKVSQIMEIAASKTDFKPSQIIISSHK